MTVGDEELARIFTRERAHLLGVGYRLTSSRADAEDAVQEAWLRLTNLTAHSRAEIRDLRGWLTTVVGRICLDRLRSATARRERYVGPWLPEPVVTSLSGSPAEDPLDVVVREDGVRLAALTVLDRLTPEQRVAFVLHDALAMPFAEIADALGCSVETARQHASRGRKAAAQADPPPRVALDEQREVLEKFLAALAMGDVDGVLSLLHPDVVLVGDSDGKAKTAARIITGADKVARFMLGLLRRYGADAATAGRPALVNGDLGVLLYATAGDEEHPPMSRRVAAFAIRDGRIVALYDIVNPDKLTRVQF
ncbi:sigma-70 family RNA polymerase sigma factor [Solihabitans fulvus]|uniref:Sigma-70 family RNA polymerase sigma factor n=1 Tax=Solihabitans fulvus TaxID=1892852 RepID=A0A5B2XT59_9PSEU|nr:sigma-70 family RNA polymerase sigma factor [Solihabitans fulvus]KAA2266044.1 sigma-70 family RNA polymerase sigma factor [Solihabitans fulvus]